MALAYERAAAYYLRDREEDRVRKRLSGHIGLSTMLCLFTTRQGSHRRLAVDGP